MLPKPSLDLLFMHIEWIKSLHRLNHRQILCAHYSDFTGPKETSLAGWWRPQTLSSQAKTCKLQLQLRS